MTRYAVIMAGGIGSRFWPMSTEEHPKQFQDFLGTGRSLLQMTFDRLAELVPAEQILVVTNARYKDQVLEQLTSLVSKNVILEPKRKNTAPCLLLASRTIADRSEQSSMIVCPSDHLITDEEGFRQKANQAFEIAENSGDLVTLGIKPHRPDTGYGYIQFNPDGEGDLRAVDSFTEKPDLKTAKSFLEAGNYYWNSGMFIWSTRSMEQGIARHTPELWNEFKDINLSNREDILHAFDACIDISIDYALLEKASNVQVILSDFGWSDLGTWGSIYKKLDKDDDGNSANQEGVKFYESAGSLVVSRRDKRIVLMHMNDVMIIDSDEALLVAPRDKEQEIKKLVEWLKAEDSGSIQ